MARGSLSCKLNHATTAICLVMALLICWQGVESTCTGNESPCVNETDPPKPLFIAFFTSFGGAYKSSGAIPAVDLALDLINNKSKPVARSNILPGFHLNYTRVYDIIVSVLTVRARNLVQAFVCAHTPKHTKNEWK